MSSLIFIGVVIMIAVVVTAAVLITQSSSRTKKTAREVEYRKARTEIERRKNRAIAEKNLFEQWQADKDLDLLQEQYIAGKDHPE